MLPCYANLFPTPMLEQQFSGSASWIVCYSSLATTMSLSPAHPQRKNDHRSLLRSLLRAMFMFNVTRRPLGAVVIITGAKEGGGLGRWMGQTCQNFQETVVQSCVKPKVTVNLL